MILNYLNRHIKICKQLKIDDINDAISLISSKIAEQKKIMTCGNGGSAHTASHYITDWNKMYQLANKGQIRGISLVDNLGVITAYANDLCFDEIFSGQLRSLGDPGDLLIAVSGSGNSVNVIKAVETAKLMGISTLSVVGYDGGRLKEISEYSVHIESFDMQICEDFHLMFGHMVMKTICGYGIKNDINK